MGGEDRVPRRAKGESTGLGAASSSSFYCRGGRKEKKKKKVDQGIAGGLGTDSFAPLFEERLCKADVNVTYTAGSNLYLAFKP